jgi:hypothetical protein
MPNIIRIIKSRMTATGHVAHKWVRSAYEDLVSKHEGKKALGRSARRWEDINMDFNEGVTGFIWLRL